MFFCLLILHRKSLKNILRNRKNIYINILKRIFHSHMLLQMYSENYFSLQIFLTVNYKSYARIVDFNMTMLLHAWSRDLLRQRIMTATITFTDLMSEYNEYQRTIARPLFVVLLDTGETINEFIEVTRNVKPISFPAWLIVFLQRPGKPLENYCQYPASNIFNVDFNTLMLVMCYDHPSLMEWYAIRDNRTRMFELATWAADGGLSFRTWKSLYARRSDMFGDIIRVASVKVSCFNVEKLLLKIIIINDLLAQNFCDATICRLAQFVIESIFEVNDTHLSRHQLR